MNKQTNQTCQLENFMLIHWTFTMARTFNYFPAAPWKKSSCSAPWSQWGCALVPTALPPIPARPLWERHTDKGRIQLPLPPIYPTSTPTDPTNLGPQTAASSHHSIVLVGSSSARLLSGPAPRHILYAQTDDTAARARQLQHKENNVLPRSFINTPNSPSQLTVNKGPLQRCGHLAL